MLERETGKEVGCGRRAGAKRWASAHRGLVTGLICFIGGLEVLTRLEPIEVLD
jgi:hypothetical protein